MSPGVAVVRSQVLRSSYRDSVELMRIAEDLKRLDGVVQAGLVMGTPSNCAVLREAGLFEGPAREAGPNDLVVAVAAADEGAADEAIATAGRLLATRAADEPSEAGSFVPTTIAEATAAASGLNLALVSTPGDYATAEALKALKRGMHVFLFSDNVAIGDEVMLKGLAEKKGLLLMGPDCGTAILDGVPLGFANAVRRGGIGLVAASGTGLQQVTCLIDRFGEGVSQAIGVGGRDLDARVGGVMMQAAIRMLADDNGTEVIVLLSKPPAPDVAQRMLATAAQTGKAVVAGFLGGDPAAAGSSGAAFAGTLEAAARHAVAAVRGEITPGGVAAGEVISRDGHVDVDVAPAVEGMARADAGELTSGQRLIRGLYSGGTLASEAKVILKAALGTADASTHSVLDLGDDEYTVGRPHPMIDPSLRNEYVVAAARDAEVGVLLFDVVLGYGAHPDPAGAIVTALAEARDVATSAGRSLVFVASVCGTETDPQGLAAQERTLADAGVRLFPSNAQAAAFAARVASSAAVAQPTA